MDSKPIRVLLVDDSALSLTIMSRLLNAQPDIEVVGQAKNGREAIELVAKMQPTIVVTDYFMPVMGGEALTQYLMEHHPLPILVVSGYLDVKASKEVFLL